MRRLCNARNRRQLMFQFTHLVLRHGLPQEHCYDLVYRHGLAVSSDGHTLLMGATTGGVWISKNGGDSWRTLSTTLPPVYAVSFG